MATPENRNWLKRIAWLLLIWSMSIVALAGVAWLIGVAMQAAGLSR